MCFISGVLFSHSFNAYGNRLLKSKMLKDDRSDYFATLALTKFNSRVSSWGDEIKTAVHPGVRDALLSGDVDLLL